MLNSEKAKKITHVISAGAPLDIALRVQLSQFFQAATIYNNYGQTELSPRALSLSSKHPDFFKGAVGTAVKGLTFKLTDENELLFSGKQVMLGYVNPDKNKIQSGWLYTQDLATIQNGVIYITGRMDDQIKVSGEKININFIEELIAKALKNSSIKIKVFACLDPLYGQQIALAYIGDLSEEDFKKEYLLPLQEKYRPKKIKKVTSFPLNENGKIDVNQLRALI
ncbi:MAG: class I adenylate-forming enzyme family protein [Bacteriovoracaceae bacterium]